MHVVG